MRLLVLLFFVSQASAFLWEPHYGFVDRNDHFAGDVVGNQVKALQLTLKNNDLDLFGDLFSAGARSATDVVEDLFAVFSASDSMQVKHARFIHHNLNDITADIKLFKGDHHVGTARIQLKKAPSSPTRWQFNKIHLVGTHDRHFHQFF